MFFERSAGEDRIEHVDGMFYTHGTSLNLMRVAGQMIQTNDDDLSEINPTRDWKKWQKKQLSIYYIVLSQKDEPVACMRFVYDSTLVVIEYLFTLPHMRGRHFGNMLIQFVCDRVTALNLFVISTEDAFPYWISRGFDQQQVSERLNPYNDTYLLKKATNA